MAGIYIHIPFCKKACSYCDFHFSTSLKYSSEMVNALCTEISMKKDRLAGQTIESIYFGGGTPSILNTREIGQILDTVEHHYLLAASAEITLEANPDDLGTAKLKEFKALPVNRFSIGVQSFYEEDLRWMNRAHHAPEAESAIKRSQDYGFDNLTIDLIYGYPLLDDEKWKNNILKAMAFGVPHLSAYSLTVEERTALAYSIRSGKQPLPDDEQSARQFLMLQKIIDENDYEAYEISNYCKPGHYAIHNTNYWHGIPYLGIGPSAHGFDGAYRYANIAHNAHYLESIAKGEIPETREELSRTNRFNEYVMTALRTKWGINLTKIRSEFGKSIAEDMLEQAKSFRYRDKLFILDDQIKLSQEGKLYADGIAADFFLEDT